MLGSSFSFSSASQNGGGDEHVATIRKRAKGPLHAFLAGSDAVISLEDAGPQTIAQLRASKKKKTLKNGMATQRKQDLFFDFMVDLFSQTGGPDSGSLANPFLERALLVADPPQDMYMSAIKERNLVQSIMNTAGKRELTAE